VDKGARCYYDCAMRRTELFVKTQKNLPKDETSINAQLLLRGGFIDKLMSGSYTILPLGQRVLSKIEQVVREEMNAAGAQELSMPLLHPKSIWEESGRWESADEIIFKIEKDGKEYALAFTHEEIILDILRKRTISYKDLPVSLYQFSNKFRNEPRARSGLLRTVEFRMKDLYSAHATEEDMQSYYTSVQEAYKKIFDRLRLPVVVAEAAGGMFTDSYTHEFQVLCPTGEDTIYYCMKCTWAQNKEIASVKKGDKCPDCGEEVQISQAIEVGNTFKLGTYYSEKIDASFVSNDGQSQPLWFASYGIGVSRIIGAIAELSHDDKGLIWPQLVSPFNCHLISLSKSTEEADKIYEKFISSGIEVLYDNRTDVSAGEKLAEADLFGISIRAISSDKTGPDSVELKSRGSSETEVLSLESAISLIKKSI